jgi:hypothetical protein
MLIIFAGEVIKKYSLTTPPDTSNGGSNGHRATEKNISEKQSLKKCTV